MWCVVVLLLCGIVVCVGVVCCMLMWYCDCLCVVSICLFVVIVWCVVLCKGVIVVLVGLDIVEFLLYW